MIYRRNILGLILITVLTYVATFITDWYNYWCLHTTTSLVIHHVSPYMVEWEVLWLRKLAFFRYLPLGTTLLSVFALVNSRLYIPIVKAFFQACLLASLYLFYLSLIGEPYSIYYLFLTPLLFYRIILPWVDNLALLFMASAFYACLGKGMIRIVERSGLRYSALGGFLTSLSISVKHSTIMLIPLLLLAEAFKGRRHLATYLAVLFLTLLGIVLSWGLTMHDLSYMFKILLLAGEPAYVNNNSIIMFLLLSLICLTLLEVYYFYIFDRRFKVLAMSRVIVFTCMLYLVFALAFLFINLEPSSISWVLPILTLTSYVSFRRDIIYLSLLYSINLLCMKMCFSGVFYGFGICYFAYPYVKCMLAPMLRMVLWDVNYSFIIILTGLLLVKLYTRVAVSR